MSESTDFIPYSPELGITGSSYRLQMGKVGKYWAIRLVKGKDVLDSKVFKDSEDMPNANILVGWVLSVLVLPNLNTYQIQKTVGFIRQKAMRKEEEMKLIKKSAGKQEAKDIKLEKTPEKEIKRPKSRGVVKEVEEEGGEQKIDAEAVSPSLAASNKAAMQGSREQKYVTIKNRELPMIPHGEGYTPNKDWKSKVTGTKRAGKEASAAVHKETSPEKGTAPGAEIVIDEKTIMQALLKSNEYNNLLKRISEIEQKVQKLAQKNEMLTNEIEVLKKELKEQKEKSG